MKIQGHLRDYPLNDLLEILANRQESGCLKIEFEPEPALFYFNKGQLVDARMSFLKGFPAVHLAFSRAEAPFDFDNQVSPPESAIINENERALLSGMLKLRLDGEDQAEALPPTLSHSAAMLAQHLSVVEETPVSVVEAQQFSIAEETPVQIVEAPAPAPIVDSPPLVTVDESKTHELNTSVFAKVIEPAITTLHRTGPLKDKFEAALRQTWTRTAPVGTSLLRQAWTRTAPARTSLLTLSNDLPRERLVKIAAIVLAVAIPATVGITLLLGKKSGAEQATVSNQEPTALIAGATQAAVSPKGASSGAAQMPPGQTPLANHAPIPNQTPPNLAKPVAKLSQPEPPKVVDERPAQPEPTPAPTPIEQPSAPAESSTSKTITVVVRVEDGHVTEAWVKDSRKGLEAYEATAIRLARQRRYPAGASRTESIPVSVSINK
jgi:hypothetical protein